jgi:glutamyl-tRNA reductase
MRLIMTGINFRSAPLSLREKVSYSAAQIPAVLKAMREKLPEAEIVIISTCNRTEIYVVGAHIEELKPRIAPAMMECSDLADTASMTEHFYSKQDFEAAQHLMAVAVSLDSMVVGETEILAQVKQAYLLAVEAETCGGFLHQLFQKALQTAKRVHSETDLCRGKVSVSSITVDFAQKVFGDLSTKTVMIIGAGETGETTLKSLCQKGVREILVLNRSPEKAQVLAEAHGGKAVPFDQLAEFLPRADIVISSTSAPHTIIHRPAVERAITERHGRPLLLLDIAVPRDIDPDVRTLDDVYFYDIDDLETVAADNRSKRQKAVEQAWDIVRAEAEEWIQSRSQRRLGALMKTLDDHANQVLEKELKKYMSKENFAALPEPAREELRAFAGRLMEKAFARPKALLRDAEKNGRWHEFEHVVRHLFEFDKDKHDPE